MHTVIPPCVLRRGVNDIGTGLQAVAAAITDPHTISAFQSEEHDEEPSHRTFYGGIHELAGSVDHAANGIQELSQVPQNMLNTCLISLCPLAWINHLLPCLQSVHHIASSISQIAHSANELARSVVSLQGAIQVTHLSSWLQKPLYICLPLFVLAQLHHRATAVAGSVAIVLSTTGVLARSCCKGCTQGTSCLYAVASLVLQT